MNSLKHGIINLPLFNRLSPQTIILQPTKYTTSDVGFMCVPLAATCPDDNDIKQISFDVCTGNEDLYNPIGIHADWEFQEGIELLEHEGTTFISIIAIVATMSETSTRSDTYLSTLATLYALMANAVNVTVDEGSLHV